MRIVYPDSAADPDNPACTDCVRFQHDLAGRTSQRIDQRGLTTGFTYDDRGLLRTQTTGTTLDTFDYDALGRLTLADRGTTADPDAVSHVTRDYTDLGDTDYETQAAGGRAAYTVNYGHDQAGNRATLSYPYGVTLTYTPTVVNRVDDIVLGAEPLVDYGYAGHRLTSRRTTTDDAVDTIVYEVGFDYDTHRRTTLVENILETNASPQTVAAYSFTHDYNGNPLSQAASGWVDFAGDDRDFTVDDLDRLVAIDYDESSTLEATKLDLVGNREWHRDRHNHEFEYGSVNAANEYADVEGISLSYDAAGNLAVDEEGRQYFYDERSRLEEIWAADNAVLARYTYDALGRRITAEFDPNGAGAYTINYVYDGQRRYSPTSRPDLDNRGREPRFFPVPTRSRPTRPCRPAQTADRGVGRYGWCYSPALRTWLVRVPMGSISISMRSPGRRKIGGLRAKPTPSGVPVRMTVSGSSVNWCER